MDKRSLSGSVARVCPEPSELSLLFKEFTCRWFSKPQTDLSVTPNSPCLRAGTQAGPQAGTLAGPGNERQGLGLSPLRTPFHWLPLPPDVSDSKSKHPGVKTSRTLH